MAQAFELAGTGNVRLHAEIYGPEQAALTVICLHGLTRNHRDFEPMIEALGGGYRFVVPDMRGRGRSEYDPDSRRYALPVYAQDVLALMDALRIPKAAFIGTSMGGLIAMVLMRKHADRVAGLVLNDVGPEIDKAGLKRIGAYAGKTPVFSNWQEAASALAYTQSMVFPTYSSDDWMAFARRTFREEADGSIAPDYDPAIAESLKGAKQGWLTRFLAWRVFARTKAAPLLVIRGALSDLLSQQTAARMVARHPDARLVTIPDVGHAPMLDEPDAVKAISTFLLAVTPA